MEMSPKPSKGISAVGIIAVILGGLGLMRSLGILRRLFFPEISRRGASLIEIIQQGTWNCSLAYFKGAMVMGLILCLFQAISGLGILKLRQWARKLMIGVSLISCALCVDLVLRSTALRRVDWSILGRVGNTIVTLVSALWFHILAVWFLTRPAVRGQFEETATRQKDS